jgi:hypothetical protein
MCSALFKGFLERDRLSAGSPWHEPVAESESLKLILQTWWLECVLMLF